MSTLPIRGISAVAAILFKIYFFFEERACVCTNFSQEETSRDEKSGSDTIFIPSFKPLDCPMAEVQVSTLLASWSELTHSLAEDVRINMLFPCAADTSRIWVKDGGRSAGFLQGKGVKRTR